VQWFACSNIAVNFGVAEGPRIEPGWSLWSAAVCQYGPARAGRQWPVWKLRHWPLPPRPAAGYASAASTGLPNTSFKDQQRNRNPAPAPTPTPAPASASLRPGQPVALRALLPAEAPGRNPRLRQAPTDGVAVWEWRPAPAGAGAPRGGTRARELCNRRSWAADGGCHPRDRRCRLSKRIVGWRAIPQAVCT